MHSVSRTISGWYAGPEASDTIRWPCIRVLAAQLVAIGTEWQEKVDKLNAEHQAALTALQVRHTSCSVVVHKLCLC